MRLLSLVDLVLEERKFGQGSLSGGHHRYGGSFIILSSLHFSMVMQEIVRFTSQTCGKARIALQQELCDG